MAYLISNTAKTLIAQAAQFITAITVADDYVVTRFSVDYQSKNWRISRFANNLFDEQALTVNEPTSRSYVEGYDRKMEIVPAMGSVKKWRVIQSKQNHFLRFIQRKRKRLAYFYASRCFIWQGWQDSNPQPSVLEGEIKNCKNNLLCCSVEKYFFQFTL
ncbi:hypothetical protein [Shewanella sp. M-Br]|uniref:hypothetical protein n=1 Tax=Shewanella sp. M-Br TaxID=2495595 RepID=UPI0030C745DA